MKKGHKEGKGTKSLLYITPYENLLLYMVYMFYVVVLTTQ